MRLADFIRRDMENILVHWEKFAAAQLPAAASMKSLALRDDAGLILEAIAQDLTQPQTEDEQEQKSLGRAPRLKGAPATAAETHALLRARSGFDIGQMAAEYRALRATVLRLWMQACGTEDIHLEDTIRFNEAIDQALAESIAFFSAEVEQARNLLLGMLGHDMRNPLHAIQATAAYLAKLNAGAEVSTAASRLIKSGGRIKALLDDLLDFNRTKLGLGINIVASDVDLADVFSDQLQQLRVVHPGRQIELDVAGDTAGVWDAHRLDQVLGNLVSNAIKYGSTDTPVRVSLIGTSNEVLFSVRNSGGQIEPAVLEQMFDPLRRGAEQQDGADQEGSLGLGLYISKEIAVAHGGDIAARSDGVETVFTVRLPRTHRRDDGEEPARIRT